MSSSTINRRVGIEHLNHIERKRLDGLKQTDLAISTLPQMLPEIDSISLLKITGISRYLEDEKGSEFSFQPMQDLITGLSSTSTSLIYIVMGSGHEIDIYIGCCRFVKKVVQAVDPLPVNVSTLISALRSAYPGIHFDQQSKDQTTDIQNRLASFEQAGLVVGTPTLKPDAGYSVASQSDRLIRGLQGSHWAYIVVAQPDIEEQCANMRSSILNHYLFKDGMTTPSRSLAAAYIEKLHALLDRLELGNSIGMWHCGVYLLTSDAQTFNHASALVRAVYTGSESKPDTVRIIPASDLSGLVQNFGLVTELDPAAYENQATGDVEKVAYPYCYLSSLHSRELTSYIHLPTTEFPGYSIRREARFDVARPPISENATHSVSLGNIMEGSVELAYEYRLPLDHMCRHGLVVGATGSGKTNTVIHILKQLWRQGVPFLVIEPAKTEYRKLMHDDEIKKDLVIFTLGNATVAPFCLNPFEIMPGVSVQMHIDHLKSVFNATFAIYAQMPHVLERCLHEIYEDQGWDLVSGKNLRGTDSNGIHHRDAHPTLTELYYKIDDVVDRLGYDQRLTLDMKAALKTRVDSLRIGAKGLMLDNRQSIPMSDLLKRPAILELENIGDDDEKALVIGILLIFLYEHHLTQGLNNTQALRHLTVIEEAHRLLAQVPPTQSPDVANTKGKAVEMFSNMLAEIRAYGEGILIVEQIPTKLASDIIKNTGLKIAHRTFAADDRQVVGATMNMVESQRQRLTSLETGLAAVSSELDDAPILVRVPNSRSQSVFFQLNKAAEDEQIKLLIQPFIEAHRQVFFDIAVALSSGVARQHHREINYIVEHVQFREAVARYVLSSVLSDEALFKEMGRLLQVISDLRHSDKQSSEIISLVLKRGVDYYFSLRGQQYNWRYDATEALRDAFLTVINGVVIKRLKEGQTDINPSKEEEFLVERFRQIYETLCRIEQYPFRGCQQVCPRRLCLYRYNVQSVTSDLQFKKKEDLDKYNKEFDMKFGPRIASGYSPTENKKQISGCFYILKHALIKEE